MARKIVYCSACKNYYEDKGRLIKMNKGELTTQELVLCTRPAFDLASWTNNNKTCGCRNTVTTSKSTKKPFNIFSW